MNFIQLQYIPILLFFLLSILFVPTWITVLRKVINPFHSFYRGQLRDVQAQGRFQPGQKGFCSILLYLFWVSILCELILFSRFMNARYNTWSKLQTHYLFDGSQTNAFHNLWPDDLTITYTSLNDGSGHIKINRALPFDLPVPKAITQNMIDLSHMVDLRYN